MNANIQKQIWAFCLLAASSFFIGATFNIVLHYTSAAASQFKASCTGYFSVFDEFNSSGVEHCIMSGYSVENIYGKNNKLRLQFGIYSPQIDPGEENLSFFGLYDTKGNLRLLFRLDGLGGNESPMILMKDTSGRNRVLMGLDLQAQNQDAFLATFNQQNYQTNMVGGFTMPVKP